MTKRAMIAGMIGTVFGVISGPFFAMFFLWVDHPLLAAIVGGIAGGSIATSLTEGRILNTRGFQTAFIGLIISFLLELYAIPTKSEYLAMTGYFLILTCSGLIVVLALSQCWGMIKERRMN